MIESTVDNEYKKLIIKKYSKIASKKQSNDANYWRKFKVPKNVIVNSKLSKQ